MLVQNIEDVQRFTDVKFWVELFALFLASVGQSGLLVLRSQRSHSHTVMSGWPASLHEVLNQKGIHNKQIPLEKNNQASLQLAFYRPK